MKAPFETISLPQSEAEGFLTGFNRPGHSALLVGPRFHSEFEESVEEFREPQAHIQDARTLDPREWVARQTAFNDQFEKSLGGLLEATMGPLTATVDPEANDAEKYIHAARQSFAQEEEPPEFIKDLEETLKDAKRVMEVQEGDPLPDLLNIMDRLQKVQDRTESLDDTLRTIQTIGQFFMGEQVAKATGADDIMNAVFDAPEAGPVSTQPQEDILFRFTDPATETIIAILPVDDPWAALAWMQHGSYMHHAPALLAVARDLAKRYGAVPVMATSDFIGFKVAKPAKTSGDDIAQAFHALNATTLNDVETPLAAPYLQDCREWRVWWD